MFEKIARNLLARLPIRQPNDAGRLDYPTIPLHRPAPQHLPRHPSNSPHMQHLAQLGHAGAHRGGANVYGQPLPPPQQRPPQRQRRLQPQPQPIGHMRHPGPMPGPVRPAPRMRPVTIDPQLPVGATAFAAHLVHPQSAQTRHGGELQTLVLNGAEIGVMTCYPFHRQDVADMFRRALGSSTPRITNLMNPTDVEVSKTYVDALPEGKAVRVGDMDVCKQTVGRKRLGSNGYAPDERTIYQVKTLLHARDPKRPQDGWRVIEHNAYVNWVDTTTPPLATYEKLWRSLYVPGRVNQGIVHCLGGVGRTPTVMWRLAFQAYLDQANRAGRVVSPQEMVSFIEQLTEKAREMRGNQVMPSRGQTHLLHESCMLALQNQHKPRPVHAPMPWQAPQHHPQQMVPPAMAPAQRGRNHGHS